MKSRTRRPPACKSTFFLGGLGVGVNNFSGVRNENPSHERLKEAQPVHFTLSTAFSRFNRGKYSGIFNHNIHLCSTSKIIEGL